MLELKVKFDFSAMDRLAKKFPTAVRDAQVSKITEVLMLLERAIKKETPYGAGPIHLRDTIHSKISVAGEKVVGVTGTPLQYGEPVEMGTKPHFPPIGPIQFWVEQKLHIEGKEARGVAFLIARAISKRGTKPHKMFMTGLEENEAMVIRILQEIPADIIRRINQ
jgi:hypothetical protein